MPIRVLVIDDDPMLLELLEDFLNDRGADVVASDFPANIAGLIRQTEPDVVLLDLLSEDGMPGVVMLGQLYGSTRRGPSLPSLILMSADHGWLSALEPPVRKLGVGLLPKPFDLDRLWQMIEQAAARG